jgi:hypothetical protein
MHDGLGVRPLEGVAHLRDDFSRIPEGDRTELLDHVVQIQPDEQLHDQVRAVRRGIDSGSDHLHDVVAVDLRSDARLSNEALACAGVLTELGREHLQSAVSPGAELFGDEHRPHPALAQQPHDPEFVPEDGSWWKSFHGLARAPTATWNSQDTELRSCVRRPSEIGFSIPRKNRRQPSAPRAAE